MNMPGERLCKLFSLLLLLGACRLAHAHPMGNFSVNHYSKITLESDRVHVDYFIDLAEIPTYQELQQANIPTTAIDPKGMPMSVATSWTSLDGYLDLMVSILGR